MESKQYIDHLNCFLKVKAKRKMIDILDLSQLTDLDDRIDLTTK